MGSRDLSMQGRNTIIKNIPTMDIYTYKKGFSSKIKEKDIILKNKEKYEIIELEKITNNPSLIKKKKISKENANMKKLIIELENRGFHKEALKVKKVMDDKGKI